MTMNLIETVDLSTQTATVTISNIPTNFKDLVVLASVRSLRANFFDNLRTNFNTGGTYYLQRLAASGGSIVANSYSRGNFIPVINAQSTTSNTFSSTQIYIVNYTSNTTKSFTAESMTEYDNSTTDNDFWAGIWNGTTAITSLTFTPNNEDFEAGSTISVYGIS